MKKILILCMSLLFVIGVFLSLIKVKADEALTNYELTRYYEANGIPTGEANTVYQTKDGYIWIGGYGGLLKYDGVSFTNYSGENGLASYSIRSISEDSDGHLLIGSNDQGVFHFDGTSFINYRLMDVDKYLSVRCFCLDNKNRIWFGTGDGLAYIEGEKVYAFDFTPLGYNNSTIYTLSIYNDILYAVDYNGALIAIDTTDLTKFTYNAPGALWPSGIYAYSALVASDGNAYVGTNGSTVYKINLSTSVSTPIDIGSITAVNTIVETENHTIWVAGDKGIGNIKNDVCTDCSYFDKCNYIYNMIEDYEHNIWAASSKYGVLKISKKQVSQLIDTNGLKDKETFAVLKSDDYYYCGYENGIALFNNNFNGVNNELVTALTGKQVHDIVETNNKIYFATYYNGVYAYDKTTHSINNIPTTGSKCRTLLVLRNGKVAVGTNFTVEIINDLTIEKSIIISTPVLCMLEQNDSSILCGTDGQGIYKVNGDSYSIYASVDNGLSGGVILRMCFDNQNTSKLFVSCGNDLFYGDINGFSKTATLSTGVGSILDIYPEDDYLWLFRTSGVLKVEKEKLLSSSLVEATTYFGIDSGLPGPVNANSFGKHIDNRFIVCTMNGIGIVNTTGYYVNDIKPKAIIQDITFSDGSIWNKVDNIITLNKSIKKLSIKFGALTYVTGNVMVEFWLEGFDQDKTYKPISDQSEVEYTNLPAGVYKFHLRATNNDGYVGDEITISFIKDPKFSETVWFPIFIFFVTALFTGAIAAIIVIESKKKQEEYRKITNQTISTISGAIDAKDPYTQGHSQRVAEYSTAIAKAMGLSKQECERIYYIAFLHDIGKIGVPDDILKKTDRLTDEEYEVLKKHTLAGGEILKDFTMLPGVAEGALYHHERYDGRGYCQGKKGEEIPLFSRIISIADTFDAMNTTRCYRKALSHDIIRAELLKGKGTQFDPNIVDIAIKVLLDDENNQ